MKIALVHPKSTFLTSPMVWPPLGLFYLSSQLEIKGHETDFFDLNVDDLPEDGEYDQMWISATSPQMFEVRKISTVVEKWQKTKTVLGGAAVWVSPNQYLDLSFDLFVAGEGDHPYVIEKILSEKDKRVLIIPISPDLDWVLPPNRRWINKYRSYMKDVNTGNLHRMTSLFTTRGCPMSCSFCESGRLGVIWNNKVRYEPMWVVEQQIRESSEMGFSGLGYYDDIFIINKKRTYEMLDLHREYGMVFRCFMRSDILHKHGGKQYLEELQRGGLIEMFIGVESADNQIKNNIYKGTTIEQDEEVLRWAKDLGITCKMSFILGLPGETLESMQRTRDWILKNRPHIVQVDRLIPFPGTPLTMFPENYDLKYEIIPEEEWFFRGRHDINSKSFTSTSNLTAEQIDNFWHDLEKELIAEGLSGYNH